MLNTNRLILRPWTLEDVDALFELAKDPEVGPACGWPPHQNVEGSRFVIQNVLNGPECYAIVSKETNQPIGCIELILKGGLAEVTGDDECELGFWLGRPYWGKGIMPEAAHRLLERAFEDLHMKTVWCGHFSTNEKSKRTQEKMGFEYHHTNENVEVNMLNEIRTCIINRMTRERWEKIK